MLPQEIHIFKEKLKEQARLADDQITLVGFYDVMYGFVEIIENDPIFSLFIKMKIKEEVEFHDNLIRKAKNKEIDKQTWHELSQMYTRDKFYFGYYIEFKNVHDDFKLIKSKILETENKEEEFKLYSDPKYYKKLSDEEIEMYISSFDKCIQRIVELINQDSQLLEIIEQKIKVDENDDENDIDIQVLYNQSSGQSTIKYKDDVINFDGRRALILDFFYQNQVGEKTFHDFNAWLNNTGNGDSNTDYRIFRQDIRDINKRVVNESKYIAGIIELSKNNQKIQTKALSFRYKIQLKN